MRVAWEEISAGREMRWSTVQIYNTMFAKPNEMGTSGNDKW